MTFGLAVGDGTGPELAAVFQRVVAHLARLHGVTLRLERSARLYQSYHSLMAAGDLETRWRLTSDDAADYEAYCRRLAGIGVSAVFRTAMNAQSLYLVRQRLHAVKVERLATDDVDLLFIRDQAQGFYACENVYDPSEDSIARRCSFSKQTTGLILDFAIGEAKRLWGTDPIDHIVMTYKFHLLDGVFSSWVREWSDRHGVDVQLHQPDRATRNLLRSGLSGRMLVIGANEWANFMHVVLLHLLGGEDQQNRHTRNVYLHPDLNGLEEYQTVHGSADDIAGRGCVNPLATMRAAAAMMDRHAGCTGAELAMKAALRRLVETGVTTPDLAGRHSTDAVVAASLDLLPIPSRPRPDTARPDAPAVAEAMPTRAMV